MCLLFGLTLTQAQMVINVMDPNDFQNREAIDDLQLTAQYQLSFVGNAQQPDKLTDETMMLQVGTKASLFYSYTRFVTDSIMVEQMKKAEGGNRQFRQEGNAGMITYRIYKNYPTGKVTTLDQIATSRFRCEENNEMPQWELHADTLTLLSYPCRKATTHFKGRDWTVWYTPDIPRSEGPWKLYGLPGLILKAEDAELHFSFTCSGIEQAKTTDSILFGAKNYQKVSRKELNRTYERFAADPIGFITSSSPNIKVMIQNEAGDKIDPKNSPYNPIERSTK